MNAPRLSAGGVIGGKYTVRSVLGVGGSVVTYHAVSAQGQEVAVKLYDPAVASHQGVMKSLEQAYATTNALPQNSSAPIVDAGYDQATVAPFSVTELLRLPSLASQQRRLPPDELLTLLKGLARSLDLAHVRGVVHGAIKPTNVFVGPSANPVVVTDFGANLAKAAFPTQEGFAQSAPWVAPEQAQGATLTPAVDVFSVGLVVFFALTGRPYWRSAQQGFDSNGWSQEIASGRVPASARAAELGVPLSPNLDMVIWRALSNDPQERFRSVGEFANVMEEALRQPAGTASTMALPTIGDAPSPLPNHMRNPERPNEGGGGMATVALTADQLMGPYGGRPPGEVSSIEALPGFQSPYGAPQAGMGQQGMGQQGMGQQAMGQQAMGQQQLGMGQGAMEGYASPGPGGMEGYGGPGPGGMDGFGAQAGGPSFASPQTQDRQGSSKVLPLILAFTGLAVIALIGTYVFLRISDDDAKVDSNSPVKVSSEASGTSAAPPPPTGEASSTQPTATASATAAVAQVELKLTCNPGPCGEILIDGATVDKDKPIMVNPGTREVQVSKPGFQTLTEKLEIKEGAAPFTKVFILKAEKQVSTATTKPTSTATTKPTSTSTGKKPPCKKGSILCK